jgi:hypothetical protein
VVQVENEELLYGTGTGHFAGFFSTSGILRHNVAGATDTTALDAIEQTIDAIEQAIEQMRSGPPGQLKVLWCVADVWHQALGERPVCHSCGSPVDGNDAYAEYKQVTVLFADVVHSMDIASVVGAERLREMIAALVDRAAVVVQCSEGTVGGFTGDGIMVVLGGRP